MTEDFERLLFHIVTQHAVWHQRFYLLVSLTISLADPTPAQLPEVVGVDVGIRYLAVTSAATDKASFHPGKRIKHQANHYARLRNACNRKALVGRNVA